MPIARSAPVGASDELLRASAELALAMGEPDSAGNELLLASRVVGEGLRQTDLSVPAIHCGGCIQKIERALGGLPGVEQARVNLSTRRVDDPLARRNAASAHRDAERRSATTPISTTPAREEKDGVLRELVRALAVAGFAASNIMMLSVSVWSGADAGDARPRSTGSPR